MGVFLFHLLIAIGIQLIINWIGRNSFQFGYLSIEQMSQSSLSFNFLLRAVTAPVSIVLVSIALYQLPNCSIFLENIWVVAAYYAVINFIFALLVGRFTLLPISSLILYFSVHSASIYISYLIYRNYLGLGPDKLLPTPDNFISELWFLVILFLYQIFNKVNMDPSDEGESKLIRRKFNSLFDKFYKKYFEILDPKIQKNDLFTILFFSVAIYENLNRNLFFRVLERFSFPILKNKTTGLMQVYSAKPLSDKESILLAQEKLIERYDLAKQILEDKDVDSLFLSQSGVKFLLRGYNTGHYAENVYRIYESIVLNGKLPENEENKSQMLLMRSRLHILNYDFIKSLNINIEAYKSKFQNPNALKDLIKYFDENQSANYYLDESIDRLLLLKDWVIEQKFENTTLKEESLKDLDIFILSLELLLMSRK